MTSDQYKQIINSVGNIFATATDISENAQQEIISACKELAEAEEREDKNDILCARDSIDRATAKYAFAQIILTNAHQIRRQVLAIANQTILF